MSSECKRPPPPPQWRLTLFLLCFACLLEGFTYSHIASFFSQFSVQEKQLTLTQYGIIMSSYCVVVLIVTPLAAWLVRLRCLTDRTILCGGLLCDATFTLLMAGAGHLPKGTTFFIGCLVLRVAQAVGRSVGVLMIYVIACAEMPSLNHVVIPVLETVYGLSVVLGPAISGALYSAKGFGTPFLVIGGTLLVFTILTIGKLPISDDKPTEDEIQTTKLDSNGTSPLWNTAIILNVIVVTHVFMLVSSNESTLAISLDYKFATKTWQSGITFMFSGISYAMSSLIGGYASKHVSDTRLIVMFALGLCTIALILQGPLIPIKDSLYLVYIAQTLLGVGTGPIFVSSYLHSVRLVKGRLPSKDMHAALMTLFNPASSIGCTLGPLVGGIILDYLSYFHLMAISVIQNIIILIILAMCVLRSRMSTPLILCQRV